MKRRIAFLFVVFVFALAFFFFTQPEVYAAEEITTTEETKAEAKKTEVNNIRLDIYWSGEIEVESDTNGVEVDSLSGSKKRRNQWTNLRVTVTADDGYVFKRLNRSSAWKLRADTSDLKVKFESVEYEDDEATLKFKYYYKDDTYEEERRSNSYNYANNRDWNYNYGYRYTWVKDRNNWFFYDEYGRPAKNEWKKIFTSATQKDEWYHFDDYGIMQTKWITVNGNTYYLDPTIGCLLTGWQYISGNWYFFETDNQYNNYGAMHRGWLLRGNDWYYLSDSGKMLTGKQNINGQYFYFLDDRNHPQYGKLLN